MRIGVQQLLTDTYPHPIGAVVREYATNALDSHIEAGNESPIEVTLPHSGNLNYTVTDHGVGLSLDDIEKVFVLYGASTKRETDAQTGSMGIGCKAGLSYGTPY